MTQIFSLSQILKSVPNVRNQIISLNEVEKDFPFVVVNNVSDNDFYGRIQLESLKAMIKQFGLIEISKPLRDTNLEDIEQGDIIIFGDVDPYEDYDFRVESSYDTVHDLNQKKFKVFDLKKHFEKIIDRLQKFVKANVGYHDYPICISSFPKVKKRKVKKSPERIRVKVKFTKDELDEYDNPVLLSRVLSYSPTRTCHRSYDRLGTQIHGDWVRIGTNQYDIHEDIRNGDRFIELENGDTVYIEEDRYGREYLTL